MVCGVVSKPIISNKRNGSNSSLENVKVKKWFESIDRPN